MSKRTDKDQQDAVNILRDNFGLTTGSVVYTRLLHVSRSGMMRVIALEISHEGDIFDISGLAARAMGARYDDRRGGVIMGGCGMDMGFAAVYSLSRALFPNGHRCTTRTVRGRYVCRSNDHVNPGPNRDIYDGQIRHADGGYALRQVWL